MVFFKFFFYKKCLGNFDWEMFRGLLEMAIYGGRIQDNLDVAILRAYLFQYFSDNDKSSIATDEIFIPSINLKIPLLSSVYVFFL